MKKSVTLLLLMIALTVSAQDIPTKEDIPAKEGIPAMEDISAKEGIAFKADIYQMLPMKYAPQYTLSGFSFEMQGDTVTVHLPYIGDVYNPTFSNDGLNFTEVCKNLKVTTKQDKKTKQNKKEREATKENKEKKGDDRTEENKEKKVSDRTEENKKKKVSDRTEENKKKKSGNRTEIEFTVRHDIVNYDFKVTLYDNGNVYIFMRPSNAESCNYSGDIVSKE